MPFSSSFLFCQAYPVIVQLDSRFIGLLTLQTKTIDQYACIMVDKDAL